VISDAEKRILKVNQVAHHVDRQDLPTAVAHDLVPNAKSRKHQPAVRDNLAVYDQRPQPFNGEDLMLQIQQRLLFGRSELSPQSEFPQHRSKSVG
jgi:hypothetical protein